jgi:glycosyltransferase involved in cell wall biosynthesis
MYHADLAAGLITRLVCKSRVVWNIRNLELPAGDVRLRTRAIRQLCALTSPIVPHAIVSCSRAAANLHRQFGYSGDKMQIIHNGIDTTHFAPAPDSGGRVRSQLGIDPAAMVIGTVARWDPLKDHMTLLKAIAAMRGRGTKLACVLVGTGMDRANRPFIEVVKALGLEEVVIPLGQRTDIAELMNALDVHVLASKSEAFPNVVAEAMACGVPCVVTSVGDAAEIVGDTGECVPPGDATALALAIESLLRKARSPEARFACRRRIEVEFSLQSMAESYLDLWQRVATAG